MGISIVWLGVWVLYLWLIFVSKSLISAFSFTFSLVAGMSFMSRYSLSSGPCSSFPVFLVVVSGPASEMLCLGNSILECLVLKIRVVCGWIYGMVVELMG